MFLSAAGFNRQTFWASLPRSVLHSVLGRRYLQQKVFAHNLILLITSNFSRARGAINSARIAAFPCQRERERRLARETATFWCQRAAQWHSRRRAGSPKPLLCNLLTLSALSQTSPPGACTSRGIHEEKEEECLLVLNLLFLQPPLPPFS